MAKKKKRQVEEEHLDPEDPILARNAYTAKRARKAPALNFIQLTPDELANIEDMCSNFPMQFSNLIEYNKRLYEERSEHSPE